MKSFPFYFTLLIVVFSCQPQKDKKETLETFTKKEKRIEHEDYVLVQPSSEPVAVLVLFGGFPEDAADVEREFKILDKATDENITVLISNFNRKLWFEKGELQGLERHITQILDKHNLPKDNVYLGGFSSGGVVSLLLGNFLSRDRPEQWVPKGLFIVDSPIDLAELYFTSEKNIEKDFSQPSVQESTWLISTLGDRFGDPNKDLRPYEKHAVYTHRTGNFANIRHLKDTRIRLYTEPDTLWWKENRRTDYQQTNAYLIEQLSHLLKEEGFSNVEYIATENKGYRSNGQRHPHSWSIVDVENLIHWIKEN